MTLPTVLRLALVAGSLGLIAVSAQAGDYGYYGDVGGRSFGAAVYSGSYSQRSASVSAHAVGYPLGHGEFARSLYYRPWYASPYRYQSYYYRPWYAYRNYYSPYFGSYLSRGYGYLGRDPWPYDNGGPYGDVPFPSYDESYGCSLPDGDFSPGAGGYGGCYYW